MDPSEALFHDLDDLVLRLKGLVLVRELRSRAYADSEELEMYSAEVEQVRDQLADLVRNGSRIERASA
jgi:proline dehydrogenase